jgi:hypothetical protein
LENLDKLAKAKTFSVIRFRCLAAAPVLFSCLITSSVSAQEVCSAASSIDLVPYFIGQSYYDVLRRAPDARGQISYIAALEGLNTTNCKSENSALSAGSCEWNNNAQILLDFLAMPESITKNGTLKLNISFVTALYELLLRRPPDYPSLNYYISVLDSGATRLSVVSSLLASPLYRERFACTSSGNANPTCNGTESIDSVPSFISQSYLDILNRYANRTEQTQWTDSTTTSQQAMCRNTSGSAFSVCDRVLEAQTLLSLFDSIGYAESNPTSGYRPFRGSVYQGPLTRRLAEPDFAEAGFSSDYEAYLYQRNATFVTALYEHLLRRAPDSTGLEYYVGYLNRTSDRVGTIYAFLTNNEYRERFGCYAGASDQLNFGINGHPFNGLAYSNTNGVDFGTQIKLVQEAGVKWYRVNIGLLSSENDFSNMDLLLSLAQAGGVHLLPVLEPLVDTNTASVTQIYNDSYSAAFATVSRYKTSIHVWELSNEEDVYSLYKLGDPWGNGTFPWEAAFGDSVVNYYPPRMAIAEAIIHGLADGARAADPGCLRIVDFGWIHTGFLQQLEDDAIPYDIVGIHWYSNVDVQTETGQNLPCTQPLQHFSLIPRLQLITNGKPLWVTEANYWPVIGNSVSLDLTLEQEYLPPALQLYKDSPSTYPIQVALIYELLDEPYSEDQGPNFGEMGIYQDTMSNGYITLGPAKPLYQSVVQTVSPR